MDTNQLIIRPEQPKDYDAIDRLNQLAFNQPNEAELVRRIRASEDYIPDISFVAEYQGKIIGHILLSFVDLVGENTFKILCLAPLAVLPDYQNQGVGSTLVKASLEGAEAKAEALVVLVGHSWFYPKFGFKPAIHCQIKHPFPVPEEAFMVKPLSHYHPQYRGTVRYPPAFMLEELLPPST
jgi:putative acetyltransferase